MDVTLYAVAAALQLAAMVYALRMMRIVDDKRPWVVLFSALLIMFAVRLILIVEPNAQNSISPWIAPLISLLILIAMFTLRNIAEAERASRLAAAKSAVERDESDRRYRALVELSPDALFVNVNGRIVYANAAAGRLFRAGSAAELVGKRPLDLVATESLALVESRTLQLKMPGAILEPVEQRWKRFDGTMIEVESVAAEVSWQGGQGIQIILRDITARKSEDRERASLLASERAARSLAEHANRMKDEFLATLSHELRTPLNAILGWSNLLRHNGGSAADIEQGLDVIERNARIQTKLIEDLLDMSRIVAGKLRLEVQQMMAIGFVEQALLTIGPTAEAKGISITQDLDVNAGPIYGDPQRLQQVVWNLLTNAIKFTPRGGTVHVSLSRVDANVEIAVTDSGQGIAPEFLGSVFDRFRQADASITRRHGGLGIGLSIVKQLVELHGGTVEATSAGDGKGATFIARLPIATGQMRHESPIQPVAPSVRDEPPSRIDINLSGLKILVVDDQPDATNLVSRVLTECGATVIPATSAESALAAVQEEKPDVLLSDIGMPGVDGYELLRQIRLLPPEQGGRVPAIALTAFARSEDRTRSLLAGYLVHVSKPVEPRELVATVASLVGRTGQAKSATVSTL